MPRSPALALLLSVLAGCGGKVAEEKLPDEMAGALCPQLEKCALGFFEIEYETMDRCLADAALFWEEVSILNDQAGCTYDAEAAGACVSELRKMDCGEFYEATEAGVCEEVWSCPG